MELNFIHLYPELMSLYGEYANLSVLKRHLEDLGVRVTITPLTFEDEKDFSSADLIYMGAGTEGGQKAVLEIQKKFGKNAVLKGMSLQEGATARERNGQIGGHRA